MTPKKKILYCVLNWGLGHACRSEPLIRELLKENELILASDGIAKSYLERSFPELTILEMPSYNIRYGTTKWHTRLSLMKQAIFQFSTLKKEKEWVLNAVQKYNIDEIISDGRFSCAHPNVKSIYITHQLNLYSGVKFLDTFLSNIHAKMVSGYEEVWVPDYEKKSHRLAGLLSEPHPKMNGKISYLGPLSRFKKAEKKETKHVLLLCSGPEPQRTLLEEGFIALAQKFTEHNFILIRGTEKAPLNYPSNCKGIDLCMKEELELYVNTSSCVLARSGYSTVMDLHELEIKKVIWIATAGQGEQEYLAKYLSSKGWGKSIKQEGPWVKKLIETFESEITKKEF